MRKIQTGDAFKLARLIKTAKLKEDIQQVFLNHREKGTSAADFGMDIVFTLINACGDNRVEEGFYDLFAGIFEKNKEELKTQSLDVTLEDFKRLAEENNLPNFLKSAFNLNVKR